MTKAELRERRHNVTLAVYVWQAALLSCAERIGTAWSGSSFETVAHALDRVLTALDLCDILNGGQYGQTAVENAEELLEQTLSLAIDSASSLIEEAEADSDLYAQIAALEAAHSDAIAAMLADSRAPETQPKPKARTRHVAGKRHKR
jgi:hypothetical protein